MQGKSSINWTKTILIRNFNPFWKYYKRLDQDHMTRNITNALQYKTKIWLPLFFVILEPSINKKTSLKSNLYTIPKLKWKNFVLNALWSHSFDSKNIVNRQKLTTNIHWNTFTVVNITYQFFVKNPYTNKLSVLFIRAILL